jgi:hypothetical protein
MNTTGNKFSVSLLESLVLKIEQQLIVLRNDALKEYPNASYQILDQLTVELSQLEISLKLSYVLKKLESGITGAEEHIVYLTKRIADLENFYFIAQEKDTDALEKSIMEIKTILIRSKRELQQKYSSEFELDLDRASLELIKQMEQQS